MLRAIDERQADAAATSTPSRTRSRDVLAVTYYFYLADVQYPGSKFILTLRDLDDWLDSRRRHVERNQRMKEAGEYDGPFLTVDLDTWAVGVPAPRGGRAHLLRGQARRPARASGRRTATGSRCATFLGHPVPDVPFPWENRDRRACRPRWRRVNNDWAFADMTASNDLLADRDALRARLEDEGYLYFKGLIDRDRILALRRDILEILAGRGWIAGGEQARRRRGDRHARPRGRRGVLHAPTTSCRSSSPSTALAHDDDLLGAVQAGARRDGLPPSAQGGAPRVPERARGEHPTAPGLPEQPGQPEADRGVDTARRLPDEAGHARRPARARTATASCRWSSASGRETARPSSRTRCATGSRGSRTTSPPATCCCSAR